MINAQVLRGNWNELKGVIREHWGELTSDDVRRFNGNVDQLVGLIQRKTGETREAVQDFLDELTADGSSTVAAAVETARQFTHRAVSSVQDSYGNVADDLRERYGNAEDMVRARPAQSVAAAFGAGLMAGVIVTLVMRGR